MTIKLITLLVGFAAKGNDYFNKVYETKFLSEKILFLGKITYSIYLNQRLFIYLFKSIIPKGSFVLRNMVLIICLIIFSSILELIKKFLMLRKTG